MKCPRASVTVTGETTSGTVLLNCAGSGIAANARRTVNRIPARSCTWTATLLPVQSLLHIARERLQRFAVSLLPFHNHEIISCPEENGVRRWPPALRQVEPRGLRGELIRARFELALALILRDLQTPHRRARHRIRRF